jgi:preprotein translocase subunit SecA
MAPVLQRLGFTVGLLRSGDSLEEKRKAYRCDVTYGPGYEFGFDYLRDQLALLNAARPRLGESFRSMIRQGIQQPLAVQGSRAFAIVDEADSVMIDEATTPLVLSGPASEHSACPESYLAARACAALLSVDRDYVADRSAKTVRLTAAGAQRAIVLADAAVLKAIDRPWQCYVEQALYSNIFLQRDVDYVVSNGRVALVDEFTGRIFEDRTLREGLHQAVEAKEGLSVTAETQPLAHITRQRFFRLYGSLCGMTGTASSSADEFREAYNLPVVRIPTRLTCRRSECPTRYFANSHSKWNAIVADIEQVHRSGRPVLVGTRTIEASEHIAQLARDRGLGVQLLNGRQDEDEAQLVARAGQQGTITIATNMAGRGTDIKLGRGVAENGGLHVVGTERHESIRVDRQLTGRAARQGDPGSCQFFVAADDSLIARYGPWLGQTMAELAGPNGEIETDLSRQVQGVQRDAERQSYARRKQLFMHDHWQQQVLNRLASEGPS